MAVKIATKMKLSKNMIADIKTIGIIHDIGKIIIDLSILDNYIFVVIVSKTTDIQFASEINTLYANNTTIYWSNDQPILVNINIQVKKVNYNYHFRRIFLL